jgi:hypothetical protein
MNLQTFGTRDEAFPMGRNRLGGGRREYLLDTGVIRSLSVRQEELLLNARGRHLFTASHLAPFEMLSGIPSLGGAGYEREYRLRRAGLRKYNDIVGPNQTYWDDEDQILSSAFGIRRAGTDKRWILAVIQACIDCSTLEQFERAVAHGGAAAERTSKSSLDVFRQADAERRAKYLQSLHFVGRLNRDVTPGPEEARNVKMLIFCLWASRQGAIGVPSESLEVMPVEEMRRIEEQVRRSYDGSLDLYIAVHGAYWEELRRGQRSLGIRSLNDPLDITNFCYMRAHDPNHYFVSDDLGILRVGRKVAADRVIDKAAFLREIR